MGTMKSPILRAEPKNVIYVKSSQTIQSVIDSCPVAVGSLREGFTNPYVVKVPPGHDKEYYSLVRNAADEANDKRNVKVIYEDNPEGKFKINMFNDCESLDGWVFSYANATLDNTYHFSGSNCIKMVSTGGDYLDAERTNLSLDLREYQGMLISVASKGGNWDEIRVYLKDSEGNRTYDSISLDFTDGTSYLPFEPYPGPDMADIKEIRFKFMLKTTEETTIYMDNIRFVRTIPAATAILRFDDGRKDQWEHIEEIEARGWRANFGIYIGALGNATKMTNDQVKKLHDNGHNLFNHTVNHLIPFDEITNTQAHYEVTANYNWQILKGFRRGFPFFVAPGGAYHTLAEKCIKRQGGMTMNNSANAFPTFYASIVSPWSSAELEKFIDFKQGGIQVILAHEIVDIDGYREILDYIETHFSYIITLDELSELFSDDWPVKFDPSYNLFDCNRVETLTDDVTVKPYELKTFTFDPGGAGRNVIPVAKIGTTFCPGNELILVNTADAAENLTFDPTFTAAGAHDGDAEADILTDSGESWTEGQLVGRTINNTTDSSSGVITANDGTTITATLTGGTDNDWDVGDSYTITPAGLNQAVGQDQRATFVYDGEGWDIVNLYDKTP